VIIFVVIFPVFNHSFNHFNHVSVSLATCGNEFIHLFKNFQENFDYRVLEQALFLDSVTDYYGDIICVEDILYKDHVDELFIVMASFYVLPTCNMFNFLINFNFK